MSQTEAMDISPDKCGEKSETESKKLCADCKTAKTPLWRAGPHGPKSLCNACGIRYRKKKAGGAVMGINKESSDKKKEKASSTATSSDSGAVMGLNKESPDKKKENPSPASSSCSSIAAVATAPSIIKKGDDDVNTSNVNRVSKDGSGNLGGSKLKVQLKGLGKEVMLLKRPRSPMKRGRSGKKLGEVEQAALLLMAISCGSVYA